MALFPLGILSAAAGGAGAVGDFELIETFIISGSSSSSVIFSNLGDYSAIYKHLQIKVVSRSTVVQNEPGGIWIRLNGDTGTSYRWQRVRGEPTVATGNDSGAGQTRALVGLSDTANSVSNAFGVSVIDILDPYSSTKAKTLRGLAAKTSNSPREIDFHSAIWSGTAAVSSITVFDDVPFVAGSRFSLYGIRG
jgi:hypothetical protein